MIMSSAPEPMAQWAQAAGAYPSAALQQQIQAAYGARPVQTNPQEIYYFTKRSMGAGGHQQQSGAASGSSGLGSWLPASSTINSAQLIDGLQSLIERVSRAIENADKQYNQQQ